MNEPAVVSAPRRRGRFEGLRLFLGGLAAGFVVVRVLGLPFARLSPQ